MATINELLTEFNAKRPRFYALRASSGWCAMDSRPDISGLYRTGTDRVVARHTDADKIAKLVKALNGASDA